ncbi:MAG: hypothetical protein U0Q16_27890 [Bryobacteraceae bacterium]
MKLLAAGMLLAWVALSQHPLLDRISGVDLWDNPLSAEDQSQLSALLGEIPKGYMAPPAPRYVWTSNQSGRTRYFALLAESVMVIPGGSTARVVLLDAGGRQILGRSFQTGWRMTPGRATFRYSPGLGRDLVALDMERFANGRNIAREYFAISGDDLHLIRLEDDKREAVQNDCVYPNYEIGFAPPAKTVAEFVRMLESNDKTEVLAALVFLGGRHLTDSRRLAFGYRESVHAQTFRTVIADARIQDLIARHRRSQSQWIRQYAELAARDPSERPMER